MSQVANLEVVRLLLRLIGKHAQRDQLKLNSTCYVHGQVFRVKALEVFSGNVAYIVFSESIAQFLKREPMLESTLDSENLREHLIVCFNWFSPQNEIDYVKLGLRLLKKDSETELEGKMFRENYISLANLVLKSNQFQTKVVSKLESISNAAYITLTGFSMGACICAVLHYELSKQSDLESRMRCIGIGSPKPGTFDYVKWFEEHAINDSYFVICSDGCNIDSVALSPNEFEWHPNCFILESGNLRQLDAADKIRYKNQSSSLLNYFCNETHSIKNYYEKAFLST